MILLSDLIKTISKSEYAQTIYSILASLGVPTTGWKTGAVVRTIIEAVSIGGAARSRIGALIARSGFRELSEGAWLTLLAWNFYDVDRKEASFARGSLVLMNTGGGIFSFDPGDLVVSAGAKTYTNVDAFSLDAFGTATITIQAHEVGTDSNAGPGAINAIVTTLLGVACSNPAALIGTDEESDEALQQRCLDKIQTIGGGLTEGAIRYWLMSAKRSDGTSYGITRVQMMPADGYGSAVTYIATATGPVPSGDVVALQTYIDKISFPYTGTFDLRGATAKNVNAACEVWIASGGLTALEAKTLIAKAITNYVAAVPIGGTVIAGSGSVRWRALLGAIEASTPMLQAKLVAEADIPMSAGDVAINGTLPADITVTVVS